MKIEEIRIFAYEIAKSCDASRVDLTGGSHSDEPIVADIEVTLRPHESGDMVDLTSRTHEARVLRDKLHPDVAMTFSFGHENRGGVRICLFEEARL